LRQHPHITDTTITTHHHNNQPQLTAYITTTQPTNPTHITNWLRTRLPEHFIPATYVTLDKLPRTPNGKIDRKALPAPTFDHAATGQTPQTPAEKLIARIWRELLDQDDINTHDNFFTLGGHSLLATRFTHRLGTELHTHIPLRLLFDHPTLADLAQHLPETGELAPVPLIPRDPAADGAVVLPASSGQRRLWLLCRLDSRAGLAYQITGAAEIHGALDVPRLREALLRTAARHESLRTTLREIDEEVMQVISPVPVVPLLETSAADWSPVLERLADEAFDLAEGPLFRAAVVHVEENRHVLLLSMHHVISDGWSVDVLLREISEHYTALTDDESAPTPPPGRVQFADIARFAETTASDDLAFWRTHLADAPTLDVPTDKPRPVHQTYNGAAVPLSLSTDTLHDMARRAGTTTFSVLASAFAIVLGRLSGQQSVVIGTPSTGRKHPDSTGIIGFLVDTMPLHLRLAPERTLKETLQAVSETVVEVLRQEYVPFARLVEELRPERDQSRSPLFQAMVAVNSTPPEYRLADSDLRPVTLPRRTAQFDLVLEVEERPDAVSGQLVYNTDLFEEPTARLIAERLNVVVDAMATTPDKVLEDVDIRTDAERARLAELSTGAPITVPDLCVHEMVEQQVDRTPDALALIASDGRFTYTELDQRANRVAHHLRGLGVGPETRVGVCLPRTSDLLVAILGVLKAGGSYVPVDPAYPTERIRHILDDSDAPVLITTADSGIQETPSRIVLALNNLDFSGVPAHRPENTASPDNLAYTIYTSGSTGRPKGVMIEHRQTTAMLTWAA
uniref:condensation domain-containing protein n=1 Tax=Saccharothrix deserti TaxID=2593674 RepID=UPI00131DB03B